MPTTAKTTSLVTATIPSRAAQPNFSDPYILKQKLASHAPLASFTLPFPALKASSSARFESVKNVIAQLVQIFALPGPANAVIFRKGQLALAEQQKSEMRCMMLFEAWANAAKKVASLVETKCHLLSASAAYQIVLCATLA